MCTFLGTISVVYVLSNRGQYYIFLFVFSRVSAEEVGEKRTKKSRKSLCIKHKDSFWRNKFVMLSKSAEGQDLSRWF